MGSSRQFQRLTLVSFNQPFTKGERIYQDYVGDFFLRVILRFIFQLETILKTIYSENSCQIENSPQNSLQTENEP